MNKKNLLIGSIRVIGGERLRLKARHGSCLLWARNDGSELFTDQHLRTKTDRLIAKHNLTPEFVQRAQQLAKNVDLPLEVVIVEMLNGAKERRKKQEFR
jgi:hypothetical protein